MAGALWRLPDRSARAILRPALAEVDTMQRLLQRLAPVAVVAIGCACAAHTAQAASEKVVYAFTTKKAGALLESSLLKVGGAFFGTASADGSGGCGTIFKVSMSGHGKTLHACQDDGDGAQPSSALVELDGVLYGTAPYGGISGQSGFGTVFSITPQGAYAQLHAFGGQDGAYPAGRVIVMDGVLYGMTAEGGAGGCGTVFSITPNGQVTTLYSFAGADGCGPIGGLTAAGTTLYGVTRFGGTGYRGKSNTGDGVVFALVPGGSETVLHAFHHPGLGLAPNGDLLLDRGALYGTTATGGDDGNGGNGGTVFRLELDGRFKVLHNFGAGEGSDGRSPNGGLLAYRGILYGTTQVGGGNGNPGTVFAVTHDGLEAVVHAFDPLHGDGETPAAGLIAAGGVLYGTTDEGGGGKQCGLPNGCGTVYSITP